MKLGIFTLQLCDNGKEMYTKAWLLMQRCCFANLNLLLFCHSCCCCLSSPLYSCRNYFTSSAYLFLSYVIGKMITKEQKIKITPLHWTFWYLFWRDDYNPLNHMDRVITIQCQLPPEPLTLDENTMLSPLEEEALSKCSQAENMVSARADGCFKTLKREVSEPQSVFFN